MKIIKVVIAETGNVNPKVRILVMGEKTERFKNLRKFVKDNTSILEVYFEEWIDEHYTILVPHQLVKGIMQ